MVMEGDVQRAAAAVKARLAQLGWNAADLARQSGIDPGTVGPFLRGKRSPRTATLTALEKAIGWEPGTIERAAQGQSIHVEAVPDTADAASVFFASMHAMTRADRIDAAVELLRQAAAGADR